MIGLTKYRNLKPDDFLFTEIRDKLGKSTSELELLFKETSNDDLTILIGYCVGSRTEQEMLLTLEKY